MFVSVYNYKLNETATNTISQSFSEEDFEKGFFLSVKTFIHFTMTAAKRLKELIIQDRNNFDAAFPKLIETAMAGLPSETSSAIAHFEKVCS